MRRLTLGLSTLALAAVAGPALSDTIATEIWAEWQAQAELTGQTMAADVTETADGLTLTNFTTTMVEDGATTTGRVDEIRLIENADGTLTVEISDTYSISFEIPDGEGGTDGTVSAVMTYEGLDVQVEGDAGARTYTYSADRIDVGQFSLTHPTEDVPSIDASIVLTELDSTYRVLGTDPETMRFTDDTTIASMTMLLDVQPPEGIRGRMKFGMLLSGFGAESEGSMITLGGPAQFADGVPPGLDIQMDGRYESFEMEFSLAYEEFLSDQLATTEATYSNGGGTLALGFSNDAISFDVGASDVSIVTTSSDIPVPVAITAASTGLGLSVPLAASDTPQDVTARLGYTDLVLGDDIWAMMDPTGAIPRDPASVVLNANAQIQLFLDLLSTDLEELDAPPGELRALTVDELRIAAAGAELTGSADLTFAPGQIEPMPEGTASLQLNGGNALLEALISGGLVPAQEGAFVRGAINAFARPGATPDSLETDIVFGADGSITANGIPLPIE